MHCTLSVVLFREQLMCFGELDMERRLAVIITIIGQVKAIWGNLNIRLGTTVAQWLMCCAANRNVAGSIPDGVIGFFIDIKSFRSHYGPGVDTAVIIIVVIFNKSNCYSGRN